VERRLGAEPVALAEAPCGRGVEIEAAVLELQQGPVRVVPVQAVLRARELQLLRAESAATALAAERAEQDGGSQAFADRLASVVASAFLVENARVGPLTNDVGGRHRLIRGPPEPCESGLQGVDGPAD